MSVTEPDGPPADIDELAIARALKRIDALIDAHPELAQVENIDRLHGALANADATDRPEEPVARGKNANPADETTQLAFRMPNGLIARLDRHVERMDRDHPGLTFTRADAVRSLLTRALDEIDASEKRKR